MARVRISRIAIVVWLGWSASLVGAQTGKGEAKDEPAKQVPKSTVIVIGNDLIALLSTYFLFQAGFPVKLLATDKILTEPMAATSGKLESSWALPLANWNNFNRGVDSLVGLAEEPEYYSVDRAALKRKDWHFKMLKTLFLDDTNDRPEALAEMVPYSIDTYRDLAEFLGEDLIDYSANGGLFIYGFRRAFDSRGFSRLHLESMRIESERQRKKDIEESIGFELFDLDAIAELDLELYPMDSYFDPQRLAEVLFAKMGIKIPKKDAAGKKDGPDNGKKKSKPKKSATGRAVEIFEDVGKITLQRKAKKITGVKTKEHKFEAGYVVIADGANIEQILRPLGKFEIHLMPVAGLSVTFPTLVIDHDPTPALTILPENIHLTPFENGTRVFVSWRLGEMREELTEFDENLIQETLELVNFLFQREKVNLFDPEHHDNRVIAKVFEWCSPDGLPFLGRYGNWDNLIIATGACSVTTTLGAGLAAVVRDQILEATNQQDRFLDRYSPDRFDSKARKGKGNVKRNEQNRDRVVIVIAPRPSRSELLEESAEQ